MKANDKQEPVSIQSIDVKHFKLKVEGISPLLMHKFSDSAKQSLLDKQAGKSKEKTKRTQAAIQIEIEEKIHRLPDRTIGFPADGFKKAMVEAATGSLLEGMNGKLCKGSFFVIANNGLVPIKFKKMEVNEAVGRLAGVGHPPMVIYRPEFRDWTAELFIRYNASQITPQQIVALANVAGFHIGVGDWRPQKNGSFGMFKVQTKGGINDAE